MLPLRDKNPSGIFPWVTYSLIAVNVLVFLFEVGLQRSELEKLAFHFGMVPLRASLALRGEVSFVTGLLIPAFTSMFLHGGWAHLLGNMWFLYIFGDNVEGRLGHTVYLMFYLACGFLAGAAQYLATPNSNVPMIGASGAIAGVLGAYYVCWPAARILTLVPIFFFITFAELPARLVLLFWFLIQLFQGAASLGVSFSHGGVAYLAHVGGFVAGLVLIKLLPPAPRRRRPARRPVRPRRPWDEPW